MQLALVLALHMAQRQGDILRLAWNQYDKGQYCFDKESDSGDWRFLFVYFLDMEGVSGSIPLPPPFFSRC
jgi:hypothetical protein